MPNPIIIPMRSAFFLSILGVEASSGESNRRGTAKFNRSDVDARGLAAELRRQVRGEVRFDEGSRALYATDGSNYRQVPIGVVIPRDVDDIIATVTAARHYGAPVLARGGGTSLAGQCCNVAVIMDLSKYMHRILGSRPLPKAGPHPARRRTRRSPRCGGDAIISPSVQIRRRTIIARSEE
jgi:hypothetical protein